MQKSPKIPNCYKCEICDVTTRNKKDYDKHLLTAKHLKRAERYEKICKNPQNPQNVQNVQYTCECGNVYKHGSGLWRHKKNCNTKSATAPLPVTNVLDQTAHEDVKMLASLVMELMKSNSELQKQLVDVCKHSHTTNNNNNHSHNKTFNLQFFLNEQCKDAMNMSDFVNTFELQLADLESVGDLGYVEGISKIIVERLNSMDIYKRPMHCSDAKRETLYIKDEDRWEKEEKNNPKLRKAIQTVSFKNMKLVNTWSDTYPESKNSESRLNDRYMKLIKQSTGGNGETADNEDKIIRRIAKEIVIEK